MIAAAVGEVAAEAPTPEQVPGGYGEFLLTSMLVLVVVCVLVWAVTKFGLRRLYPGTTGSSHGPIKVIARLSLEPRQTLYVVDVGGKTLVIGSGDRPVNLVAELDADQVTAAMADISRPSSFADVLKRLTGRGRRGEEPAS